MSRFINFSKNIFKSLFYLNRFAHYRDFVNFTYCDRWCLVQDMFFKHIDNKSDQFGSVGDVNAFYSPMILYHTFIFID